MYDGILRVADGAWSWFLLESHFRQDGMDIRYNYDSSLGSVGQTASAKWIIMLRTTLIEARDSALHEGFAALSWQYT